MVTLSTNAVDGSTYIITATFTDEDGNSVTPNTLTWSLRNGAGNIVNEREDVSVTPAASVEVVLSGDDLLYSDGHARYFTLSGTYDSDAGTGLPLRAEAYFLIDNLVGV
jgi:hypothetical protein